MRTPTSIAFRAVFSGSKVCSIQPLTHSAANEQGRLRINVLFTDYAETLEALKSVTALIAGLPEEVTLLVPVTVPYPLPLEEPPVPLGFACRRISELAASVTGDADFGAYIYLCRNPVETILKALRPHSLVMIGVRRRWFFNKSKRFVRKLRSQGHEVILVSYS